MSPRYIPSDRRTAAAIEVYPPPARSPRGEGDRLADVANRDYLDALAETRSDPYAPAGPFSFYRDLLTIHRGQVRRQGTFDAPRFTQTDPGPDPDHLTPGAFQSEEHAARRIARSLKESRDVTSSTGQAPDFLRPSMPGRLLEIWGRAARRVSGLVDELPRIPLERGMVDNSGTQPLVRIPALSTGAGVATQVENAALQETDPTSTGIASPLGTIAGQVDASRQLVDFSTPSIDDVLTDDLSVRLAESLDAQLLNGSGAAGTLRGFLNVTGILTTVGVVTNQTTYLQSLLQAFSLIAGSTGYGSADRDVIVALHPRRWSWLQAGFAYPVEQLLPGRVALVPNAPATLGAGTNEDWSLVIERSAVQLIGGAPVIRVFEEVGSSSQTVRFSAHADAALALLNPKAVCRVTAGTAPAGF